MKKKIIKLVIVGSCIFGVCFGVDLVRHYEKYDSIARYNLMLDLEKGDTEAFIYYYNNYISKDIYLFDGDISFNMFCIKYNIQNKKEVYQQYKQSNKSLNDFVKGYKKELK